MDGKKVRRTVRCLWSTRNKQKAPMNLQQPAIGREHDSLRSRSELPRIRPTKTTARLSSCQSSSLELFSSGSSTVDSSRHREQETEMERKLSDRSSGPNGVSSCEPHYWRRNAVCEETEKDIINDEGVSLRDMRKLLSARFVLLELNIL